jgi:hypothetical protein
MTKTIWTLAEAKRKHRHSAGLADALASLLPASQPVLDLGCGQGFYLQHLAERGYRCLGVEGTPGIRDIAFFPGIVTADLSKPLELDWSRSSIICLEVAEHLLPEQEAQLLETIDRYCGQWLVLSWAVPGQRGHGHNNCRSNDYVRDRFAQRGFQMQPELTDRLRTEVDEHTRYFRRTLQVFTRPQA